jgi:hypothetical protein
MAFDGQRGTVARSPKAPRTTPLRASYWHEDELAEYPELLPEE